MKSDAERRAHQLFSAWLRGITEGGHPPPSREELAEVYRIALENAKAGR